MPKFRWITILVLFFLVIPISDVNASMTVTPFKEEVLISPEERLQKTVSLTNNSTTSIKISPTVFSYDPQTQTLIDTENYVFVRTDKEVFTVKPKETLTLNYEIVPPSNIKEGSYFNIIILTKETDDLTNIKKNIVGATDSLSHLVVMHVVKKDNSVYGISSDFAVTTITIEENGIPFIRPTKIKYVYQNISNYVLEPMGEIQIYNNKGNYSPEYIKINEEGTKLYPGGTIEKEIDIENIHIADILNGRSIVGRFYNGIDEGFNLVEVEQEPDYIFISIFCISLGTLIILLKSLLFDRKKTKKNPVGL